MPDKSEVEGEKMYEKRPKINFIIALGYWLLNMCGLLAMGILHKNGVKNYHVIPWLLLVIAILIVIIKDKSIIGLGFTMEKVKINLIISTIIIITTFGISVIIGKYPILKLLEYSSYYLIYVAVREEIAYRGIIQNYLFGLNCNKYVIFLIGAVMFSLGHIPFQMYVHNNVSLSYIIEVLPQLALLCVIHVMLCFITYKRKDITIPIALHFALNYLQL